jgi:hypothetical protein
MLWLKRNFFLAFGGFLALLMLGGGGYYLWTSRAKNAEVEAQLQEKRTQLEQIYNDTSKPFPNETNIGTAKAELEKVRAVVQQAKTWFSPIVPPPVSPQEFRILLENAVFQLRRHAEQQATVLPSRNYAFSFEAQRKGLTFGPGTFPAMPQQLTEIHALCTLLFDAHINKLISVRRTPVSADDEAAKASTDYHDLPIHTNALTQCVISPYIFEFQCFSQELGTIVQQFQRSTNGFLLKSLTVDPAPAAPAVDPSAPPGTPAPPVQPGQRVAPKPAAPPDPFGKTVLDERQLKVMMLVEVIKCPAGTNTVKIASASN